MVKSMRTLISGLFVTSLFLLAGCNGNMHDRYDGGTYTRYEACSPCGSNPACGECPDPRDNTNPYFPCDPSAAPCGNGSCEPAPEQCYGRMQQKCCDDSCSVEICQCAPEFAIVGSPYPIEIYVTARKECAEVVINQTLPCEAEFVKSDPPATPDANGNVRWEFPHMKQGETQKVCVWLKPTREGCCLAAATVCACPQICSYTNCSQPVICIQKWGPECACVNCPVCYEIEVCNSGSAPAYDVVVVDQVPEGLCHESGMRCLTYNLGCIQPGQSKRINVNFIAASRGCVTNRATVTYCGGPKCVAEASTLINEPCVEVTKTGPEWAYICKTVDYTITVTNPGDLILTDVVVDDVSANGTTIVAAPGAEICCNRAIWCLPQLCPGETKTFTVSVRSQTPGHLTNQVAVSSCSDCGPCTCCAEATTEWRGIAATHMCMVDTSDPVCIGQTTTYRICVTNRGSAEDKNVRLVIKFTNELQPQSANGPTKATINGQTVEFAPLESLGPKQSFEYCITVKGVSAGDARGEARLDSDSLGAPVVDTESTHVY
jgi:uncharacterized repeat protein (TIGR01451 family)